MSRDPEAGSSRFAHSDTTDASATRQDVHTIRQADDLIGEDRVGLWERLGDRRATAASAALAGGVLLGVLFVMSMITDGITFSSDETRPAGDGTSIVAPSEDAGTPSETTAPSPPSDSPSEPAERQQPEGSASPDDDDHDDYDDLDDDDEDDDEES
ncbi:hypothetical protein K6168_04470 [Streptomyces sp. FB2]|uniref:hypothetical protein n=1 Tax=Streptomyces sp. FB2 TaxID=2902454 RepID=UPI001F3F7F72|nr:hypothetical protein [Streptomyces sp. FB2]MCF2534931.1 hypothetical protein [Streptomyces sp. FB2]